MTSGRSQSSSVLLTTYKGEGFEDPPLTQRMGRRSRRITEDKYDVHQVNAVTLREMGISGAPAAQEGTV